MADKVIKIYKLIQSHQSLTVEETVNELITMGWQPFGAPTCSIAHDGNTSFDADGDITLYIQAMVVYDDESSN